MTALSAPEQSWDPDHLSPREIEVLQLLAQGLGNKDIGERLGIRPHTVRNHLQHIIEKLDAHSKLGAVVAAVRLGLVTIPLDE